MSDSPAVRRPCCPATLLPGAPGAMHSAGTAYKTLNDSLLESLEAFEAGRLLGAIQPLLALLDQLERMKGDEEIEVGRIDEKRIQEYRSTLRKIMPGNKPELEETGRKT